MAGEKFKKLSDYEARMVATEILGDLPVVDETDKNRLEEAINSRDKSKIEKVSEDIKDRLVKAGVKPIGLDNLDNNVQGSRFDEPPKPKTKYIPPKAGDRL